MKPVKSGDCTDHCAERLTVPSRDLAIVPADKCLDVSDNSSANGARAQIWTCTGAANQKWRLQF
ncbi:RICIN domain-containing protein [Streptomyces sp. NBC_00210]|uniref:RICIN domain-containing protein n=1 Tax=unclassified Streptomyces TaxID=2593676 RepID=UPI003249124C